MLSKKFLLGITLIIFLSSKIMSQTADEIISKYIDYTGGEKKWKSVNTIVTSGIYNYGGIEFPFTTYSKSPDLYKFIVPFNGKYYEQAFDGKQGWKIDAFKNETSKTYLSGKAAKAMANEADVELESAFINYKEKGYQAIYEGKDTVEGIQCFKIKFIKPANDTAMYFFKPDNFELVKKQAVSKNAEMQNALLDTYYSNYQEINNLKFPFKSTSKSGDQTILIITTQKIELNVPVADSTFK